MLSNRRRFGSLAAIIAAALLLGVGMPAVAAADEMAPDEHAKELYARGKSHFNLAEFEEALSAFKAGYKLDPDPAFLFRMAECHERLREVDKARFLYERYLDEAPEGPNADEAKEGLARLEEKGDARDPDVEEYDDDDDGYGDDDDDDGYGDDDDDDDGYYGDGEGSGRVDAGGPDPTALKVWKSLRTVGMVVTIVGGAMAVAGGITLAVAISNDQQVDDLYRGIGVGLIGAGAGIAIVFGVPLWIMGAVSVGGLKGRARSAASPGRITLAPGVTLLPYAAPLPDGGALGGFHLTF